MAATSLLFLMLVKTAQCRQNCSGAKSKAGQHGSASVSSVASQTMQPGFCLWISVKSYFRKTEFCIFWFQIKPCSLVWTLHQILSRVWPLSQLITPQCPSTTSYQTPCTGFSWSLTVSSLLVCLRCKLHQPPVPVFQWLLFAHT